MHTPHRHTPERSLLRAILTDEQFWLPFVVLVLGIVLLILVDRV